MLRYCVARIDNSTRLVLELQKVCGYLNVRAGKVEPEEPAKRPDTFSPYRLFTRIL